MEQGADVKIPGPEEMKLLIQICFEAKNTGAILNLFGQVPNFGEFINAHFFYRQDCKNVLLKIEESLNHVPLYDTLRDLVEQLLYTNKSLSNLREFVQKECF